jgi:hypothetical protein
LDLPNKIVDASAVSGLLNVAGSVAANGTLEQYAALVDHSKLDAMKDAGLRSQQ